MSRLSFHSMRARTAFGGIAAAMLVLGGQTLPAAAATTERGDNATYQFALFTRNDVTQFIPCPSSAPYHFMCGIASGIPLTATNTGDDAALTGTITESYFNALDYPAPNLPLCQVALKDFSSVSLKTSAGEIHLLTHHGSYCASSNYDLEPFTIIGGTGKYSGAHGFGIVTAFQTGPGLATEFFNGVITVGR